MDGFVFDTNIADTARKYHIYDNSSSSKYDSLVVSLKSEDTSVVRGFYEAIKGMRYGETAEALSLLRTATAAPVRPGPPPPPRYLPMLL